MPNTTDELQQYGDALAVAALAYARLMQRAGAATLPVEREAEGAVKLAVARWHMARGRSRRGFTCTARDMAPGGEGWSMGTAVRSAAGRCFRCKAAEAWLVNAGTPEDPAWWFACDACRVKLMRAAGWRAMEWRRLEAEHGR